MITRVSLELAGTAIGAELALLNLAKDAGGHGSNARGEADGTAHVAKWDAGTLDDFLSTLKYSTTPTQEDKDGWAEDHPETVKLWDSRDADSVKGVLDHLGIKVDREFDHLGTKDKVYAVTIGGKACVVDDFEAKTAEDWLSRVNDPTDYVDLGDFNKDFWERPGELYHATEEEHLDDILRDGLVPKSETRGLTNRGTGSAVFTTTNQDTAASGSYGNVVLRIDTDAMKKAGHTPDVALEEAANMAEAWSALANLVGIEDYSYEDSDPGAADPETVVVFGRIPPKFIAVVGN